MPEEVNYTPVPCLCSGKISNKITDAIEVVIYDSPIDSFNGPIYAKNVFQPGHDDNLKIGDLVKVMVTFTFGGIENKFIDVFPGSRNYILGAFKEDSISDVSIETVISEGDSDRVRFLNKKSGAGIVATDNGKVIVATGGSIYSAGSPFGFGINENFWKTMAQNHHRVISHNGPYYLSREHFGLFTGSDSNDRLTRLSEEDHLIVFRRFVTQSKSPDNWVSTCEGAWAPWVGPNNDSDVVESGRETLLSKVVNHGESRATIEIGDPGDEFINIRLDDVKISEKALPTGNGATPAVFGNRFKMTISDEGAFDIRAAGKGVPGANFNGFHMSVDKSGKLIIHAANGIEISHGDSDGGINSIKMDPKKGVDITAKNGFRVNGVPVVNKNYLDWMEKYQTQLCLVTSIGGPAPINPIALPEFLTGNKLPGKFNTNDVGIVASMIIKDADAFNSV